MSSTLWTADEQEKLECLLRKEFDDAAIEFVVGQYVDDLLQSTEQAMLRRQDLASLRSGFAPPKAFFTVSWWAFSGPIDFDVEGVVTLGNYKKVRVASSSLLKVVTMNTLGAPDCAAPLTFQYLSEARSFQLLPWSCVGLM